MTTYLFDIKLFDWNKNVRCFSTSNQKLKPKILKDSKPDLIEIINPKTNQSRTFKSVGLYEEYFPIYNEQGEEEGFHLEYLVYQNQEEKLDLHIFLETNITSLIEL